MMGLELLPFSVINLHIGLAKNDVAESHIPEMPKSRHNILWNVGSRTVHHGDQSEVARVVNSVLMIHGSTARLMTGTKE